MSTRRPHIEQQKWMPFINRDGNAIPPYGIVQITNVESFDYGAGNEETVLRAVMPGNNVSSSNFAINDGQTVPANQLGRCTRSSPALVQVISPPAIDGSLGAKANTFSAVTTEKGLTYHGLVRDGIGYVSFTAEGAQNWGLVGKTPANGVAGIDAANRPGIATVTLYAVNLAANPDQLISLNTTQVVYNVRKQSIDGDIFVPLLREAGSGTWLALGGGGTSDVLIARSSPGAPIDARDGNSLSNQSCEVFTIEADALVTTGEFETIYNLSDEDIPADTYFAAFRDQNSGLWIAEASASPAGVVEIARAPSSGIPGRTVTFPPVAGKATCDIYETDPDTGETTDTGEDEPVFNFAEFAVRPNAWIYVAKMRGGGRLAIWEECPPLE